MLLHHHPRTLIQVTVQITGAATKKDGSGTYALQYEPEVDDDSRSLHMGPDRSIPATELAASVNAASLALLDAAIPMRATVIAASCAVVPEKALAAGQRGKVVDGCWYVYCTTGH